MKPFTATGPNQRHGKTMFITVTWLTLNAFGSYKDWIVLRCSPQLKGHVLCHVYFASKIYHNLN